MKRLIFIAVVSVLLMMHMIPAYAEDVDTGPSFTAYSKFWPKYIGGNGGVFSENPVIQGGLTVGWGDGYSVDLWGSRSIDGEPGFGNEVDVTGCKSTSFNEAWSLDVCVGWYHLTPKGFGDIISPTAKLARRFRLSDDHTLTISAGLELYFPTGKLPDEGGILPTFKAHEAWTATPYLTVNNSLLLTPDHGAFGNDKTVLFGYEGNLSWKLTDRLSVQAPAVKFVTPTTKVGDGRKPTTVVGTGMVYRFDWNDLGKLFGK